MTIVTLSCVKKVIRVIVGNVGQCQGDRLGAGFLLSTTLGPSTKHFQLLAVNGKSPGSGQIHDRVLNLLTEGLPQEDDLRKSGGIQDKPDLRF